MQFGDRLEEVIVNLCSELKLSQNMIHELERERRELLQNISATVQAKEATEKYAKELELQIDRMKHAVHTLDQRTVGEIDEILEEKTDDPTEQFYGYGGDKPNGLDPRRHETSDFGSENAQSTAQSTSLPPSNSLPRNSAYDEAGPGVRGRKVPSTEEILPIRRNGLCATDLAGELQKGVEGVQRGLRFEAEASSGTEVRRTDNRGRNEGRVVHRKETF